MPRSGRPLKQAVTKRRKAPAVMRRNGFSAVGRFSTTSHHDLRAQRHPSSDTVRGAATPCIRRRSAPGVRFGYCLADRSLWPANRRSSNKSARTRYPAPFTVCRLCCHCESGRLSCVEQANQRAKSARITAQSRCRWGHAQVLSLEGWRRP